jgi:hypothetical protein
MKKLTILLFALVSAFTAMAQKQPFEKYGYKVKIATLSKGKYIEHFDQDTIVQIGTVLMNRRSGKIVSFVKYDTALGEYSLKPELVSRWVSPDPLAHEFYSESPYNFGHNNPIRFVDPDGRAPWDVITTLSNIFTNSSGITTRQADIVVTMKVVNTVGADLSKTMFSGGKGTIDMSNTFGGIGLQLGEEGVHGHVQTNISSIIVQFEVVDNLDAVGKNDHVMMVVNSIPKGEYEGKISDPVGLATTSGRVAAVEAGTIGDGTFNNVTEHEIGHNLGLEHRQGGLMNPSVNGSSSVNSLEKGQVASGTHVGPKDGSGVYKASSTYGRSDSKSLAKDFLKTHGIN